MVRTLQNMSFMDLLSDGKALGSFDLLAKPVE